MSTRHLIEVKIDNDLKIAQYGQGDGYYTGQGVDIAKFIDEMDLKKFSKALKKTSFMTKQEIKDFNDEWRGKNWQKKYPWLSRDCGSDILNLVQDGVADKLHDSRDFKEDKFCDFHYLIDMDEQHVYINDKKPISFKDFTVELMEKMQNEENEG